jgi:outer membrane phospholipase A
LLLAPVAQPTCDPLLAGVRWSAADHELLIDVRLLNPGALPQTIALPEMVTATLSRSNETRALPAERLPASPAALTVPAMGFATARYRLVLPPDLTSLDGSLLEVPGWGAQRVAALKDAPDSGSAATAAVSPDTPAPKIERAAGPVESNTFLANLSAYEPVYAVYGPGTDSDARLQLSFKYQLFGAAAPPDRRRSWAQGIFFAYTQRMFWDLGAKSSPFHNIDFMPELLYQTPDIPLGDKVRIGGQAGFRHESNGRSGDASRSMNMIYVQPHAVLTTGQYRLTFGPRLWVYAGNLSDNPDIRHYRGNSGFFLRVGSKDGIEVRLDSRLNPGSGKGALDTTISYPIDQIVGGDLNLYLFGQVFTGYGENLLDYDRRMTRARIGIGIVR